MTLGERQRLFTRLVAKLIEHAYEHGYELTLGEAWRTPEQAALNAKAGKGIAQSLHGMRLAIDLNLFRNGEYLTASEDHKPLGEYWKTLHPDCCWGGDFSRPDGNHYSLQFGGIR
jgi:hypothetical protein